MIFFKWCISYYLKIIYTSGLFCEGLLCYKLWQPSMVWYVHDTPQNHSMVYDTLPSRHSAMYDTPRSCRSAVCHKPLRWLFVKFLPEYFAKNRNCRSVWVPPMAPGGAIWWKNHHSKILWHCPFKICIGIRWYLGAKKLGLTEIEQLLLDFILRASIFSEAYSGLLFPLRNYLHYLRMKD